jgi:peptidyl-prolyl cis-trans isomerase SurA
MRLDFKFFIISIVTFFTMLNSLLAEIYIDTRIDEKIITNFDISREANYLQLLNPEISSLNKNQINSLARQSLINEIIKKIEISKFINIDKEIEFIEGNYSNLILRLGYKDEKSFKEALIKKNTYSVDEIKLKIKIDFYWRDLIFNKFKDQIVLDQYEIQKKIKKIEFTKIKDFLLSEIVFQKKKEEDIKVTITKILKAIDEIGFGNAANLYSISESSKFGGKVGWVSENFLSQRIYEEINKLEINQVSNIIKLSDKFVILKINDIKFKENEMSKENEIKKIIEDEQNDKLKKFSRIYFNKIKINYSISEK